MNHSSVIKYVESGYVMSYHGQWVPVAQAVADEDEYFSHLEKGQVVVNGNWTTLEDLADSISPAGRFESNDEDSRRRGEDRLIQQETVVIDVGDLRTQGEFFPSRSRADESTDSSPAELPEDISIEADTEHRPISTFRAEDTVKLEIPADIINALPKDSRQTTAGDPAGEDDGWEKIREKRRRLRMIILSVSAAVAVAGITTIVLCW